MYGGESFPNVPDAKIVPFLTETQKKVWRTVNQQSNVFWGFNVGMDQGIAIADEQWDEEVVEDSGMATGKEPAKQPAEAREASAEASE